MKFYLDTADRQEAAALLKTGLFAGLTTNPALLAKAGVRNQDIPGVVAWAIDAGAATVFVQAWGSNAAEIEDKGRWLASLSSDLVVKVPATAAGLEATGRLTAGGIPVLVTAVYAASQALPAIAAGASYLAPYLGRMNDAGRNGHDEIATIQRSIDAVGSSMKLLVASLREPEQASALSALGISEFTMAPSTWHKFFADPLTAAAVKSFDDDTASMD